MDSYTEMDEATWETISNKVLSELSIEKMEELCRGVTTSAEVAKFLGKSREPILEGALINVHHKLACEPIPGKPHQILITDHHLWHDYIDYFAGSKPNQTKSRVNRNKSFSSRWFKMPPGRKPKSFIIETYPARRKDVERKLAIVRSKVGDSANPKKLKIGDEIKTFTPPNPNQLLILLAQRKLNHTKAVLGTGIKPRVGKKRPRRSSTRAMEKIEKDKLLEEEIEELGDEEFESDEVEDLADDKYDPDLDMEDSNPKSPKKLRLSMDQGEESSISTDIFYPIKEEPNAAASELSSSSEDLEIHSPSSNESTETLPAGVTRTCADDDLERGTFLLNYLRNFKMSEIC